MCVSPFSIRPFAHSDIEYGLSLLLRYRILRLPLGLTFSKQDLANDVFDTHIGAFCGDELMGCLILTDTKNGTLKMRQVAVDNARQRQGVGSALVQFADTWAAQKGYKRMYCHARKTAVSFYLRLGYSLVGEEFTEVSIPHYHMQKQLCD